VACDGSFPTANILVPEILDGCPTKTIREFFRKIWRYMDAYHQFGALLGVSALHYSTGSQNLRGFRQWLQLMHCTNLLSHV